jgi:hypothetical protein
MQQNSLEIISVVFGAGESRLFQISGQYFELIDCPDPVDVTLSDQYGAQRGIMRQAEASFHLRNTEFRTVQIFSATAQTVRFAYGTGEGGTRRTSGTVQLAGEQGAYTQAAAAVTNASAQLVAANTQRRYLLIQNKSQTGTIYVNLAGAAATVANGVLIGPGESLELEGYTPTNAVFAIGDIANNPDVVVVEG